MLEDLLVKGQELRLIVVREGVAGPGAYDKVKFSDSQIVGSEEKLFS